MPPPPAVDPVDPTAGRAEIVVDLAAVRHNVRLLCERAGGAAMMTVVKADAYGHGLAPVARAARDAGATWLGVAVAEEALALRAAGDTGRVLSWLTVPGQDYTATLEQDIDVTAYTPEEVAEISAAARSLGRRARVQLKVDTGLSRGGAVGEDWERLVVAAAEAEQTGALQVTGVWSHLACADEPDHPANDAQQATFEEALGVVGGCALEPEVVHLANSAATLHRPGSHYGLVRCGIASYGLAPAPEVATAAELGLVPAMTVLGRLAMVKRVPAGSGVSYGHTYHVAQDSTVALVPMGYGDGVPRHASSRAALLVAGRQRTVAGRVCMDQLVVDLGDDHAEAGDPVVLFGPGTAGEPTAQDWAKACGTISYEIVTRIGGRQTRTYLGGDEPADGDEPGEDTIG